MKQKLETTWRTWSLARQFAVSASLVLLPAMVIAGFWVGKLVEDSAARRSAAAAALYLENFVEPVVQDLLQSDKLTKEGIATLDRTLSDTSLSRRVLSVKVWGQGGVILYASRKELIGKTFAPTPHLRQAWQGQVAAEFDNLDDPENAGERAMGRPIIEIYLPLRKRGSETIIAVAEFYEVADDLVQELRAATWKSRLMIAALTFAMLAALFALVRRGSQTIDAQRAALEGRIADLTRLLEENQSLRQKLQMASDRATEGSEALLRRLGADLHDGPAQLIGVALLKLNDSGSAVSGNDTRSILQRALNELRSIAAGFAVPEIEQASLKDALATAVERHEQVTGTSVELTTAQLPPRAPAGLKLCVYRVVQEGLSNAFRHAGGVDQKVWAGLENGQLVVQVTDAGLGQSPARPSGEGGLGLPGLKDRVESLGGTLELSRCPAAGMRLRVVLPLTESGNV